MNHDFEPCDGDYLEFSSEEEKTMPCVDGHSDKDETFNQLYVQNNAQSKNLSHNTVEAKSMGQGGHLFGKNSYFSFQKCSIKFF